MKDNGIIWVGLCKPPLHFSGSEHSKKLFIAHDEQVQGDRHAKFGEWARVELEKGPGERLLFCHRERAKTLTSQSQKSRPKGKIRGKTEKYYPVYIIS